MDYYVYNLIIKRGDLDNEAARAMVNRELTTRFHPAIHYTISALLDNEVVVQVWSDSKRMMQVLLAEWFIEHAGLDFQHTSFPVATLLHYREITPDEPLHSQLGG